MDATRPTSSAAEAVAPRVLIAQLCRQFYGLGWVTGTGGGLSVRDGYARPPTPASSPAPRSRPPRTHAARSACPRAPSSDTIYVAPSGVQKERMEPEDMFEINLAGEELARPARPWKKSQCTPLFLEAYRLRSAGAVIHTHSIHAVMVTLLYGSEFRITHQEMIKGVRKSDESWHKYYDELVVPIIENTAEEADLADRLAAAIKAYPTSQAVLVRRHGVYVWGKTWAEAKTVCECYDYLFDVAVRMRQLGLDPAAVPVASEYAHLTHAHAH